MSAHVKTPGAHSALRQRLSDGQGALVLVVLPGLAVLLSLVLDNGVQLLPALLLCSLAAAAALTPGLWRAMRVLPLLVGLALMLMTGAAAVASYEPLTMSPAAVGLVMLGTWLLQRLVRRIFSRSAPRLLVHSADTDALPAEADFGKALRDEVARSRRHAHSFVLLVIRSGALSARAMVSPGGLDGALSSGMRVSDRALLGRQDDELIVICPESGLDSVAKVSARIRAVLPADLRGRARIGSAVFPTEALTPDLLLALATRRASEACASPASEGLDYGQPTRLYGQP